MGFVVAELERTILKDPDPFAYFMLIAFEASGPIRFAILLLFWPIICLLDMLGKQDVALRLTIFIAVAGIQISEIEYVGRAILPKFYMEDIDMSAWGVFSQYGNKVVVTRTPRVMVERFVKDHLMVDHVIGSELVVNRFGFATGFVMQVGSYDSRVDKVIGDHQSCLLLGRSCLFGSTTFQEAPAAAQNPPLEDHAEGASSKPRPVIFHDGRLAKKPKPSTALVIILWFPLGVLIGIIRIICALIIPMGVFPFEHIIAGTHFKVKGPVPSQRHNAATSGGGVLFVCNHRTLVDPAIISHLLHRKITAVTYSLSRVSEVLAPFPTMRLTRNRLMDGEIMRKELEKGDLVICPEGTTCREPFLLRFSALFAELTDQIVPVGLIYHPYFFHSTTARGWKAMDLMFYCMNPTTLYEVTFLDKLEAKDIRGKTPYEVANYVQSLLGNALGFQCTDYTRKDKYRMLAENDGIVPSPSTTNSWWFALRKFVRHWSFRP
ncbi:glycerol-3-phosphate acyltransferase 7-like [Silene latifolia]|uniref:glycerol-3-phosphate acyltransferase 7-like n=1 Tax=Silene latifolia TaxID=37657 RepID=UPI003D777F1A